MTVYLCSTQLVDSLPMQYLTSKLCTGTELDEWNVYYMVKYKTSRLFTMVQYRTSKLGAVPSWGLGVLVQYLASEQRPLVQYLAEDCIL